MIQLGKIKGKIDQLYFSNQTTPSENNFLVEFILTQEKSLEALETKC